jgi:hypothetical protein
VVKKIDGYHAHYRKAVRDPIQLAWMVKEIAG